MASLGDDDNVRGNMNVEEEQVPGFVCMDLARGDDDKMDDTNDDNKRSRTSVASNIAASLDQNRITPSPGPEYAAPARSSPEVLAGNDVFSPPAPGTVGHSTAGVTQRTSTAMASMLASRPDAATLLDDDDASDASLMAMQPVLLSSMAGAPPAVLSTADPLVDSTQGRASLPLPVATSSSVASLPSAAQNLLTSSVMGMPPFMAAPTSQTNRAMETVQQAMDTAVETTTTESAQDKDQDWKETQRELDKLFDEQSANKFAAIPAFSMPDGFRADVELYDYQKDGIRWMAFQETDCDQLPPFTKAKMRENSDEVLYYWCSLTRRRNKTKPEPCLGSILADDMGLGKSIQTLGLMLSNPPSGTSENCSIIVCPVSVIANWKIQIKDFVQPNFWEVAVYHGPKRERILARVKRGEIDVLLMSYETLASDFKQHEEMLEELEEEKEEAKRRRKSKKAKRDEVRAAWDGSDSDGWEPDDDDSEEDDDHVLPASILKKRKRKQSRVWIFDLFFHRIILDEAHKIRNSDTGYFKSTMKIQAQHKLCLTGTPFVNHPRDIHSLLAFLGAEPLSDKSVFNTFVVDPILATREIGLARIRTAMSHLALRRTKKAVHGVIDMVPKQLILKSVEWPDGGYHSSVHTALYETARAAFIGLLRAGGQCVFDNFYAFLVLVLRVRQSCCHADLVPEESRLMAEKVHSEGIDLGAVEGEDLLNQLRNVLRGQQDASDMADVETECAVCCEELVDETAVVLRSCKHVLCENCLNQISNQLCPFCREPYTEGDMVKWNVAERAAKSGKVAAKKQDPNACAEIAPKVQALLGEIEKMAKDEKAVIFSQWTSYLNVIQHVLQEEGHEITRIDGSMTAAERIRAMEEFSSDDDKSPRFILCSLHACGTGINLTRGNVVFMLDFWWNRAMESQAMDRVHRIGQKRNVRVVRFCMKDSIEERMVNLQDAKTALGKGSLQKLTKEERKKARITALKDLFQLKEEMVQKWDGYYEDDEDDGGDLDDFIVDDDHVEYE